jgi:hypothetical protein
MKQRRRFPKTSSLDQRLVREAQNLRKQAEGMPAGIPKGEPVEEGPHTSGRNSLPHPRMGIVAKPDNVEVIALF